MSIIVWAIFSVRIDWGLILEGRFDVSPHVRHGMSPRRPLANEAFAQHSLKLFAGLNIENYR
jgi:hypothetical protein